MTTRQGATLVRRRVTSEIETVRGLVEVAFSKPQEPLTLLTLESPHEQKSSQNYWSSSKVPRDLPAIPIATSTTLGAPASLFPDRK